MALVLLPGGASPTGPLGSVAVAVVSGRTGPTERPRALSAPSDGAAGQIGAPGRLQSSIGPFDSPRRGTPMNPAASLEAGFARTSSPSLVRPRGAAFGPTPGASPLRIRTAGPGLSQDDSSRRGEPQAGFRSFWFHGQAA